MNRLASMIANKEISVQELASAYELIERARLVEDGIKACKKVICFQLGNNSVNCYRYIDSAGEYESWASCNVEGTITFFSNWGGNHEIGKFNLMDSSEAFLAFENDELFSDLTRFFKMKIAESRK